MVTDLRSNFNKSVEKLILVELVKGLPVQTGFGVAQLYCKDFKGERWVDLMFTGLPYYCSCELDHISYDTVMMYFLDPEKGEERRRGLQLLNKTGKRLLVQERKRQTDVIDKKIKDLCSRFDKDNNLNDGYSLGLYIADWKSTLSYELDLNHYNKIHLPPFVFRNTGYTADLLRCLSRYNEIYLDNQLTYTQEIKRLKGHYLKLRAQAWSGEWPKQKTFAGLCDEIQKEFKTLPLEFIKILIKRLTWRDKILGNGALWEKTRLKKTKNKTL
jgi:hypothetical protein